MNERLNGPAKLAGFPLATIGDRVLELLGSMGVTAPVVFIAVADADTGEVISSGNISEEHTLDLLRFLVQSHEEKTISEVPEGGETLQ